MEPYNKDLLLENYKTQKPLWPQEGKHILAQYDNETIIVYQAYCREIANPTVKSQDFITNNPLFSPTRMTWFKPGFLWMMYRSGWASKRNQECILAFRVNRVWFENTLREAKLTSQKNCKNHNVVVQWDPDHHPGGNKHKSRKALQVGIRGAKAQEWSLGNKGPAIAEIKDISDIVHSANQSRLSASDFLMPKEIVYNFECQNIDLIAG